MIFLGRYAAEDLITHEEFWGTRRPLDITFHIRTPEGFRGKPSHSITEASENCIYRSPFGDAYAVAVCNLEEDGSRWYAVGTNSQHVAAVFRDIAQETLTEEELQAGATEAARQCQASWLNIVHSKDADFRRVVENSHFALEHTVGVSRDMQKRGAIHLSAALATIAGDRSEETRENLYGHRKALQEMQHLIPELDNDLDLAALSYGEIADLLGVDDIGDFSNLVEYGSIDNVYSIRLIAGNPGWGEKSFVVNREQLDSAKETKSKR